MTLPGPTLEVLTESNRLLTQQNAGLMREIEKLRDEVAGYKNPTPRPMRNSPAAWARAFAVQAVADLGAREALLASSQNVSPCQHLHFLQMAAEKVAKARCCFGGDDPASLQHSHAYAAKVLPLIFRERFKTPGSKQDLLKQMRKLAREIELLAPTVRDDGRRPDNCEYPWEDDEGQLRTPAEWPFGILAGLDRFPMGITLLKVIVVAAEELAGDFYSPL